ncbi:MAG: hypothetical protein E5X74_18745 [Mesorhizobium sp.]|uniref:hypothetical protein n=1 Tax=Mesorhizobium sp. TaxID=1871066 RepID=UPI00120BE9CE|nr:hypothetical protein [Mesorhizobium sp.]TIO74441.1 MAG: hypothetical protein E5X75_23940 [Mesorhizobium sp.]TIO83773.1 MAG: hypothetical protein E5X74_18745 [Mesorhizobium sp.]
MTDDDPILPSTMVHGVYVPKMRKSERDRLNRDINAGVKSVLARHGIREPEEPVVAVIRVCFEVDQFGGFSHPVKAYLNDEDADRWIEEAPKGDRTFIYTDLHGTGIAHQLGEIWTRVRYLANRPDKWDHNDLGDILVRFAMGQLNEMEAMGELDDLENGRER